MEVVYPNCGFKGNIRDERIPDSGRKVTCLRCKTEFFVKKNRSAKPESGTGENLISNPPGGSYGTNISKPNEGGRKRSPILVCSVLLVTAAFFYILGLISGVIVYEADSESDIKVSESVGI
ncbi:MAG: zinc-ribbon domain-containing protein [Deltaproteobacteria bacterium]|uniref:Zinc-ribbon domain-containing protein n=1 Tax=Candidatus Zymogenus saltonus TaxID=2844893 RepID=A0A9D8PNB4_9DELT|nr:zinc-ribbon domain-containing protein [Candidatus Zymogenus saltonus]